METQSERRRLLEDGGGEEDPTGLVSEQDAYLRSVHTTQRHKETKRQRDKDT